MTDPSQEPVEQVQVEGTVVPADPGNTDPAYLTEDLSDDELLEANAAVEEVIASLPTDNGGVVQ